MTLGACSARLAPRTGLAPGTSTSAFSLRTSTTARRTGTTQIGWYEALSTSARSTLASPFGPTGVPVSITAGHLAIGQAHGGSAGRRRPVGQVDAERRAAPLALLEPGAAAVQLGEAGDERQADADAGGVGGGVGPAPERLEDARPDLGRHPGAGVLDRQQHAVVGGPHPDPHRRLRRGVPGGVGEQGLDDSLHLARVPPDRDRARRRPPPPA